MYKHELIAPLRFTRDVPKEPGWYWIKCPGNPARVGEVFRSGTAIRVDLCGCGGFGLQSRLLRDCVYAGPIQEPLPEDDAAAPCPCGERPGMMKCQDCGPGESCPATAKYGPIKRPAMMANLDAIDRNNADQVEAARMWSNSTRPDGAEPAKEIRCKYCKGTGKNILGIMGFCTHCHGTGRSDGRERKEADHA